MFAAECETNKSDALRKYVTAGGRAVISQVYILLSGCMRKTTVIISFTTIYAMAGAVMLKPLSTQYHHCTLFVAYWNGYLLLRFPNTCATGATEHTKPQSHKSTKRNVPFDSSSR